MTHFFSDKGSKHSLTKTGVWTFFPGGSLWKQPQWSQNSVKNHTLLQPDRKPLITLSSRFFCHMTVELCGCTNGFQWEFFVSQTKGDSRLVGNSSAFYWFCICNYARKTIVSQWSIHILCSLEYWILSHFIKSMSLFFNPEITTWVSECPSTVNTPCILVSLLFLLTRYSNKLSPPRVTFMSWFGWFMPTEKTLIMSHNILVFFSGMTFGQVCASTWLTFRVVFSTCAATPCPSSPDGFAPVLPASLLPLLQPPPQDIIHHPESV